tara:strand:+ start:1934 stop:2401 length:468 start_codon:yes stop_codon:yes gene_type:complete
MAGHTPTRWVTGILLLVGMLVSMLAFTDNFLAENNVEYMNHTWANLSTSVTDIANNTITNDIYDNANNSLTAWEDESTVSFGALSYWDKMIQALGIASRSLTGLGEIASSLITPAGQGTGLSDSEAGQTLILILTTCMIIAILFMILRAMTGRDL